MGDWGVGNFENDTALDWLADFTHGMLEEIQTAMESPDTLEPDEWEGNVVPCNIEVLCVLAEKNYGPRWPEMDVLESWKTIYMDVWEKTIDSLEPKGAYKEERRKVLLQTFDRMLALARTYHSRFN